MESILFSILRSRYDHSRKFSFQTLLSPFVGKWSYGHFIKWPVGSSIAEFELIQYNNFRASPLSILTNLLARGMAVPFELQAAMANATANLQRMPMGEGAAPETNCCTTTSGTSAEVAGACSYSQNKSAQFTSYSTNYSVFYLSLIWYLQWAISVGKAKRKRTTFTASQAGFLEKVKKNVWFRSYTYQIMLAILILQQNTGYIGQGADNRGQHPRFLYKMFAQCNMGLGFFCGFWLLLTNQIIRKSQRTLAFSWTLKALHLTRSKSI